MTIERSENGDTLQLRLHGHIDTATAPVLERELQELSPFKQIKLDFSDVAYVSSAGLRVLLLARKTLKAKENILLTGVNEDVMDILDMTGFLDILTAQP